MSSKHTNRLAGETSPYLLQHANNPVDWHPWGESALALAREQDKPVLLSIGYSACHWCHVMAHESFEDEAIAALMNQLYVNIKLDREERPDLDKLYQIAHQLLAQRGGGWPLTVFIDPADKLPFFAGTYFPSQPRHGMPAFPEVLKRVAAFYHSQRDEIANQKQPLIDVFQRIDATDIATGDMDRKPIAALRRELEQTFDARHGGFGGAPKFPHPEALERLLHHWADSRRNEPDARALHIAVFTLQAMIEGGLYDQLGGGFYRYSVDAQWQIPHFEKMLYDNGPLLALTAQSYAATGNELFARASIETADWVMREMQSPEGGYYATLDADSEGVEGKFYAWDAAAAQTVVGDADWPLVAAHFGLDQAANFDENHHLHVAVPRDALATQHHLDAAQVNAQIERARAAMGAQRDTRVRPGRDDKILTSWNAMMIRGMAMAARQLNKPEYADSADRAVQFIRDHLWHDDRLLASWKDGRARFRAYLDDHAFLIDALIELLQVRWHTPDLEMAVKLADILLDKFADEENGGFYFTPDDHESLFHRSRPLSDDATPSGNAIAARALTRLGYLLGETRYLDAAERTLRAAWDPMREQSQGHAAMTGALAEFLNPPAMIVLRGDKQKLAAATAALNKSWQPDQLVFAIAGDAPELPAALSVRAPRGDFVAYICRGHTCTTSETLDQLHDAVWRT